MQTVLGGLSLPFRRVCAFNGQARGVLAIRQGRVCSTEAKAHAASAASTTTKLVHVKQSPLDTVHILELQATPSSALTAPLMADLLASLRTLCDPDAEQKCEGVILTSAAPNVFNGGLDADVLRRDTQKETFANYWDQFQQLFATLHSLPIPLAAALCGHVGTAGAIIALAADCRVMSRTQANGGATSICVDTVLRRLVVPPYVAGSLARVVGFRRAEELLVTGRAVSADEAHQMGLVDEVVDEPDEAVVPCLEFMEKMVALPSPLPFWIVKDNARKDILAPLCTAALRAADVDNFYETTQRSSLR